MSLFAFGVNHKTAPVQIRERVSFGHEHLSSALTELIELPGVSEAAILSTCNRTEVYCSLSEPAKTLLFDWLERHHKLDSAALHPCLFSYNDAQVVEHVMRVACGLDSMVLGEPQILGQLKSAYQTALEVGTLGKLLNKLFQYSFAVAKQVRTDTAIGSSPVSVAFAAVRLAQQIFGDLDRHTALLIGAGETIELAARHLHENGLGRMIVTNRSLEKAQRIASEFGGFAIALTDMPRHLPDTDIVISSTASALPILGKGAVERALRARRHRPMFMVDIAVPRDIEPEIGDLDDIYLYTVDDLETVIEENLNSRRAAALQAQEMIEGQVMHFMEWLNSLDAVSTVRALRARAEHVQSETVAKALRRIANGEDPHLVVELLARTLTNKLIHLPSVRLREASAVGRSELIEATRELFDLDTERGQEN